MTDTTAPAWLTEGATVAIYTAGMGLANASVALKKVDRVLKNYAVVDGRKFRLNGLTDISHKDSRWSPTPRLLDPSDPAVIKTIRAAKAREIVEAMSATISTSRLSGGAPLELLRQVEVIKDAAIIASERLSKLVTEAANEDG